MPHDTSKPADPTRPLHLTRREAVLAAAAVASTSLLGWSASGVAQPAATAAAGATGTAVDAAAVGRFFAFSQAITGHADIDAVTAGRIRAAMVQGDGAFAAQAETLAGLVQPGMAPDALLAAASGAGLRDAALAVVAAWYTGTVTAGPATTVVAYEQALMYRPVADGLSVPTYCNEGPLWWTAAPPEVGVPTPQQAAQAKPKPPPPPVMRSQ